MSPTQRTLAHLRKRGLEAQVVEYWLAPARKRRDLYGVIDVLAMSADDLIGVQATSDSNLSARRTKCEQSESLKLWLQSPSRAFELHGWGKVGSRYRLRRYEALLTPHGIIWVDEDGDSWGRSAGLDVM